MCDGGCYDLCEMCYVRGAGCKDRSHSLKKCTPAGRERFTKDYVKSVFSDESKDQVREYLNEKRAKISSRHNNK